MVQYGVLERHLQADRQKLAAWVLWGVCIAVAQALRNFAGYIQGIALFRI